MSDYYLFNYFWATHGLTLTESEIEDIRNVVKYEQEHTKG